MKYLMLIITFFMCNPAHANSVLKVNKERLIEVVGPIRDLQASADAVLALSEASSDRIFIKLDTYGGSVIGGLKLIQAIERAKTRGVRVVCYVENASMSMGTHIMAACSKNYVLESSLIMWHPVSISFMMVRITPDDAKRLHEGMELLVGFLEKKLKARLGLSDEDYEYYHKNEHIIPGVD